MLWLPTVVCLPSLTRQVEAAEARELDERRSLGRSSISDTPRGSRPACGTMSKAPVKLCRHRGVIPCSAWYTGGNRPTVKTCSISSKGRPQRDAFTPFLRRMKKVLAKTPFLETHNMPLIPYWVLDNVGQVTRATGLLPRFLRGVIQNFRGSDFVKKVYFWFIVSPTSSSRFGFQ